MRISVLKSGTKTLVQDLGRHHGLANGVPTGGAMDKEAVKWGNLLLGNPVGNPMLECALDVGTYRFDEELHFVIVGDGNKATLNNVSIALNTVVAASAGAILKVSMSPKNRYTYLGFKGKIVADEYWGSYGTYEFVGKGGFRGRALKKGDCIEVVACPSLKPIYDKQLLYPSVKKIRVHKGPESNLLGDDAFQQFVQSTFRIAQNSNRMGYRLQAEDTSLFSHDLSMISAGAIPGTIQVPPNGNPIVLMADGPCTGGYLRIAVVDSRDLRILSNALPGEKIQFVSA